MWIRYVGYASAIGGWVVGSPSGWWVFAWALALLGCASIADWGAAAPASLLPRRISRSWRWMFGAVSVAAVGLLASLAWEAEAPQRVGLGLIAGGLVLIVLPRFDLLIVRRISRATG